MCVGGGCAYECAGYLGISAKHQIPFLVYPFLLYCLDLASLTDLEVHQRQLRNQPWESAYPCLAIVGFKCVYPGSLI